MTTVGRFISTEEGEKQFLQISPSQFDGDTFLVLVLLNTGTPQIRSSTIAQKKIKEIKGERCVICSGHRFFGRRRRYSV